MSQAHPIPFFIHFVVTKVEGDKPWRLEPDSYSLPKGPPPLEPSFHQSATIAAMHAVSVAEGYNAGWTIRTANHAAPVDEAEPAPV